MSLLGSGRRGTSPLPNIQLYEAQFHPQNLEAEKTPPGPEFPAKGLRGRNYGFDKITNQFIGSIVYMYHQEMAHLWCLAL
jgi:hypothetical protein